MDYVSHKTVNILERRLGLLHLSIFSVILAYIVGVRIIFEKGYQAVERSTGFVSARLEGLSYTTGGGRAFPADLASLVAPQMESDAMFIPTHITSTRQQIMDNCTDPAQACGSDTDCMRLPPVAYGVCEDGHCMQLGWCPRQPSDTSETTVLQNLRDLPPGEQRQLFVCGRPRALPLLARAGGEKKTKRAACVNASACR